MTIRPALLIAVVAGALPLVAAEEALLNGGFESPSIGKDAEIETNPDDWKLFSSVEGSEKIGLTSKASHAGKQSARIAAQGKMDSYQGLFQTLPANLGATYEFKAYVRNDNASPLKSPARGQMSVEWKDAGGSEIERSWGPEWGESLPASHWTKVEMTARPPANAVTVHFVITQFDGKGEAGSGAFLVDDIELRQTK